MPDDPPSFSEGYVRPSKPRTEEENNSKFKDDGDQWGTVPLFKVKLRWKEVYQWATLLTESNKTISFEVRVTSFNQCKVDHLITHMLHVFFAAF